MASVGIIDVDLLTGRESRFPNLAAMKLSAWHKATGDTVTLLPKYEYISDFSLVYLCCVFTSSAETVPGKLLSLPHVSHGGTGFFFDKAPPLPPPIEHSRPDYSLYQPWAQGREHLLYYQNASLGRLTRGCFRRCSFCVNRNCQRVELASPFVEFYDPSRNRVRLLDDNLLGHKDHYALIQEVVTACERDGTQFEMKEGTDIRLLRQETAELFGSKSHFGEIICAFDSIKDAPSVRKGLGVLRRSLPSKGAKAYILCGFDSQGWEDIASIFRRLEILWEYHCLGYLMRHEKHISASPVCRRLYAPLAAWINQPRFQRAISFRQFCAIAKGKSLRSMEFFSKAYPDLAARFFDSTYAGQPQAF